MGGLQLKGESLPTRCDICHQADCFDAETNYCSRCAETFSKTFLVNKIKNLNNPARRMSVSAFIGTFVGITVGMFFGIGFAMKLMIFNSYFTFVMMIIWATLFSFVGNWIGNAVSWVRHRIRNIR
jgi:ABC-type polysaccharide/polyol phosphate export permease